MPSSRDVASRIAVELLQAGLRPGAVILVHSSLSKLGWVEGGPDTVIRGLQQALGPGGTLLLPAFSYATVGSMNPHFDVRNTTCCVGAIPEYFRQQPGVIRSVHPTHSVCGVGRLAEPICAGHILDHTPVGAHSPLRKVRDFYGQVVFLGCGMAPNTSMHGVEELARPPYVLRGYINYQAVLADGSPCQLVHRHHDFRGWRQRYERLQAFLEPGKDLHIGRVLDGTVHILEAQALWAKALAQYRADPFSFVERITS
ncbi:MAG: AAC(3) family N-acetyltransferase [Anaerolineae bacterium]